MKPTDKSCPGAAFRIIDAHTHIGPCHLSGWHQRAASVPVESMLQTCARLGIGSIVTAPHPLLQGHMEEANRLCAQNVARFPGRVYGYISVVPRCGLAAVKNEIGTYAGKPGFVGLKFLPGYYHGALTAPEYAYAMDFANEAKCPVLCHIWDDDPHLSDVEAALRTRRGMRFILAHQGGGHSAETDRAARLLQTYENVFMELCGSLENHYGVEDIVALAGEDRVIFGTDQINLDPKYELGRVLFAPLTDRVKQKIFAENFLSLLGDSQLDRIR